METEQLYFRYSDLERVYGIKKNTAYTLVHRGLIPFHRVSKRIILFSKTDIEKWITGNNRNVIAKLSSYSGGGK